MSEITTSARLSAGLATHPRSRAAAVAELMKLRIVGLVLVATAVGFLLARRSAFDLAAAWSLFHTLLGTALIGAGGNALNQYLEADLDALMVRTRRRPLPSGRLSSLEAMGFGLTALVVGVGYLALQVNSLSAALAAFAGVSYVAVYTPLKRMTSACVLIGAIPGALPPVIGWAGADDGLSNGAWMLFAIVYFWQLPHFAAIAWQYREDYEAAGYPMLSVVDRDGTRFGLHMMTHTAALIAASLLPALRGVVGPAYAVGAMILGTAFLAFCVVFLHAPTKRRARAVVLASVVYLPLLLGLMLVDKR